MVETRRQAHAAHQAGTPFVAVCCRPDVAAPIAEHLGPGTFKSLRLACRAARAPFAAGVRSVRGWSAADLANAARGFPHAAHGSVVGPFQPGDVARILAAAAGIEELVVLDVVDDGCPVQHHQQQQQPHRQRQRQWPHPVHLAPAVQPRLRTLHLCFGDPVSVSPGLLALAQDVRRLPALRELNLRGSGRASSESLGAALLPALPPALTALTLHGLSLAPAAAGESGAAVPQSLEALDIRWCNLDRGGLGGAEALLGALPPSLRQLSLERTGLAAAAAGALARRIPVLTALAQLYMDNCDGSDDSAASFLGALPPSLRTVDIESWHFGERSYAALAGAAAHLTALEELSLQLPDPLGAATLMAALPASLRSLCLTDASGKKRAASPGIAALAARLPALDHLRTLQLSDTSLEGCGAALAALPAGLHSLELNECALDAGAMTALAGRMHALTALEEAKLAGTLRGDMGALVAALPPSLRVLHVALTDDPAFGEAAAAALAARMPALARLEAFELEGDWSASSPALLMAALPLSLRELSLYRCSLGPAGAAALVARAPALVALRHVCVNWRLTSPEQEAALHAAVPAWCKVRNGSY